MKPKNIVVLGTTLLMLSIVVMGCGQSDRTDQPQVVEAEPQSTESDEAEAEPQVTDAEPPAAEPSEAESETPDPVTKSEEIDEFRIEWTVVGDTLEFAVSAPTTGWVAVGFEPVRMMQGANIIIGYVQDGSAVVTDQVGTSTITHDLDTRNGGNDDLIEFSGTETDGRTEIRFRMPLDSGDEADQPLVPGNEHTIILAYGNRDDLQSYHVDRTIARIIL